MAKGDPVLRVFSETADSLMGLDNEHRGIMIGLMIDYTFTRSVIVPDDQIIKAVWPIIEQKLEWSEGYFKGKSKAGKAGGEAKAKNQKAKKAVASSGKAVADSQQEVSQPSSILRPPSSGIHPPPPSPSSSTARKEDEFHDEFDDDDDEEEDAMIVYTDPVGIDYTLRQYILRSGISYEPRLRQMINTWRQHGVKDDVIRIAFDQALINCKHASALITYMFETIKSYVERGYRTIDDVMEGEKQRVSR